MPRTRVNCWPTVGHRAKPQPEADALQDGDVNALKSRDADSRRHAAVGYSFPVACSAQALSLSLIFLRSDPSGSGL